MAAGKTIVINEKALASDINSMAGWGAIGARPDTGDVLAGSFYYDTTNSILYQEQNGAWVAILSVKTLNPANETVEAGYYAATTLSAVDGDLATANIRGGFIIFGIVGSNDVQNVSDADALVADVKDPKTFYSVTGARKTGTLVETIERVSHGNLAAGATYTPSDPGIYQLYQGHTGSQGEIHTEVYCTTNTTWYDIPASLDSYQLIAFCTEGASARIKNVDGSYSQEYSLIRIHISGGTYEEVVDEQMSASEVYTPVASSSLFGGGEGFAPMLEYQRAAATWWSAQQIKGTGFCPSDGTNIRFHNTNVSAAKHAALLRAKLL